MASNVFPFLNTGQMFAVFHMAGIVPDSYDILNMTVSIGAMNGASSFKTLGVILSDSAALVGFSLLRSFSTPDTVMLMSFISGVVPYISSLMMKNYFWTFKVKRNIDEEDQHISQLCFNVFFSMSIKM